MDMMMMMITSYILHCYDTAAGTQHLAAVVTAVWPLAPNDRNGVDYYCFWY